MNASSPAPAMARRALNWAGASRTRAVAVGAALPLALVLSACGGSSGSAGAPAAASAAAPSASPSAGGQSGGQGGQGGQGNRTFPGTSGLIAAAAPGSLQVQGTDAQTTVTYTATTRFTATVTGALAAGQCVTVTGTPVSGSTTAITATSVRIEAKVNGACPTAGARGPGGGFGGGFGGGAGGNGGTGAPRPTGAPSGAPNGGARQFSFAFATGTVSSVSGATMTMQGVLRSAGRGAGAGSTASAAPTTATAITVTLASTATVTQTVATTSTAAVVGKCATAIGKTDDRGDVAATSIAISAPTASGCTAGFGRGGFGGGAGGSGAGTGTEAAPVRSRKRRSGTAKAVTAVAVGVVVLVVAGSVTAYAATRTAAPNYRTAAVSTQTVEQVLQSTGTIEPGTSASASFPVSGTVVSVQAVLGNHVTKGQQLAALDTTSLKSAVASANATVTHAELTVYQAEHGQTSSSSSGGSGSSGSGSGGSGSSGSNSTSAAVSSSSASASRVSTGATGRGGSGGSGSGSGGASGVAGAQQRLVASVHAVDLALAKAKTDLALAATLCATTPAPGATTASPAASASASPAAGGPPAGGGTPVPTTCAQAQQLVLSDETQILAMQQGVSSQEAALDKLIAAAAASAAKSSSSKSSSSRTTTKTTTTTVSAAQLAADQAAVDAAVAALAVANQELAQAVITAPMTGTVSAVGVTVGEQVSAGSSSEAIDVISPTQHSVSLLVDVTKVPLVKVGQQATVLPDGSNVWLPATVSYVGAAPSTSGGTSYLVRLSFAGAPAGLRNGIQASVKLVVANAAGAVSVPTSAVQHLGSVAYVTVLSDGALKRQVVTLGAVGAEYTQVSKGLTVGQEVVLANMDEAIPTSTVTTRFARFAGGTGLGGGLGTATGGFGAGGGAGAGRG